MARHRGLGVVPARIAVLAVCWGMLGAAGCMREAAPPTGSAAGPCVVLVDAQQEYVYGQDDVSYSVEDVPARGCWVKGLKPFSETAIWGTGRPHKPGQAEGSYPQIGWAPADGYSLGLYDDLGHLLGTSEVFSVVVGEQRGAAGRPPAGGPAEGAR